MDWTTSCPDWEARILNQQSLVPFAPLFPKEAAEAIEVFKDLHIVDAPGQPTFREAGEPWVFDFVEAIFGAYDAVSGNRLVNEFFLCVAKKNGKSTIAAGIMLTALIRNWRNSNELIIVAPTIKAADNSFKPAADMVRANPELNASEGGFLYIQDHLRTITHTETKATLRILAADAGTVAGNKAAFVLVDELWEFGSRKSADSMMREAAGGLVARPEGFLIAITTQSDEPPAGVFKAKLDYARSVRDGRVQDPKFLPIIYEFPRSMIEAGAYLDRSNFYITNPHIGRTAWGMDWIEKELNKEKEKGPDTRNVFLAKHLNVEIGLNLRSDRWAGADYWEQRADPTLTLDELLNRCEVVTVGIDGGGLDDLLGLAVLGREKVTRRWLLWTHAWAHPIVLERRKEIAPRLLDFEKDGDLTFVKEIGDDIEDVCEILDGINAQGLFPEQKGIGVDPAGITDILDGLAVRGFSAGDETSNVVGVKQGWTLTSIIKTTERKLAKERLVHNGSALMNWCVSNAKVVPQGNAITITKQASGSAKIDPLMATFDAAFCMALNPEISQFSSDNIRFL